MDQHSNNRFNPLLRNTSARIIRPREELLMNSCISKQDVMFSVTALQCVCVCVAFLTFTYVNEVRPVLAGHPETKVPPEACVFLDHLQESTPKKCKRKNIARIYDDEQFPLGRKYERKNNMISFGPHRQWHDGLHARFQSKSIVKTNVLRCGPGQVTSKLHIKDDTERFPEKSPVNILGSCTFVWPR